jgi:hypothetical protein
MTKSLQFLNVGRTPMRSVAVGTTADVSRPQVVTAHFADQSPRRTALEEES